MNRAFTQGTVLISMTVLLVGCDAGSSLGSSESFEAMTGVALQLRRPPVHCVLGGWGAEVVGVWVFDFGPSATLSLLTPPEVFWTYPKLDLGVETNRVVTWQKGWPTGDDAKAFTSAISIQASTQQNNSRGNCSDNAFRADLGSLFQKPTTYFAYQYRAEEEHPDFPYNLHFFILDSALGTMYELIDTSGGSFK